MTNNSYNSDVQVPQKKWYKTPWGIALIILLFLILVSLSTFGFYVYSLIQKIKSGDTSLEQAWQTAMLEPGPYEMANSSSSWTGATNPKITIVEFADFNCPFCRNSYQTIREISFKYKDSVKFIFRHYPVIQDNSLSLALASECANEQGKFWPMHDALFQSSNPGENIDKIISNIGLNVNQFNNCLQTQKYLNKIKLDFLDAQKTAITGTPTWFINGHKIAGEIPREQFFQLIKTLTSPKL